MCVYRIEKDAKASPLGQKSQKSTTNKQQHTQRKATQDFPIRLEWVGWASKNTAREEMENPQTVGSGYGAACDASLLHKTEARMAPVVTENPILIQ